MSVEIRDYIASQTTSENLDELQRMSLAYSLGFNIALDGPPGVGKTQSVLAFARLIGKKVFEKGCSEDTTENQIIGFPKLTEKNGATITVYENGPLCSAMEEASVFYGDEFNLLRRDKQKRLNSAFDDRRRINRADGVEIAAKEGFAAIISYNPSSAMSVQDIEESVADRFIHFNYKYMPAKIEAYLGTFKIPESSGMVKPSADVFGIKLEKRAILIERNGGIKITFLIFMPDKKCWVNFFTGGPVTSIENGDKTTLGVYYSNKFLDKHIVNNQTIPDETRMSAIVQDYSVRIAGFANTIRHMARFGSSSLPPSVRAVFASLGETGQVALHIPSLRIHTAAVSHLVSLIRMGMDIKLAANYASGLVINQICFGKFRDRKSGDLTGYEIVSCIAESFGLIPPGEIEKVNKRFTKKSADEK